MFNWRVNADVAKGLLWGEKKPVVDELWLQSLARWNAANPPVGPPPDFTVGNCTFSFFATGPDQLNRVYQTEDSTWIKSYNGLSLGPYIDFNDGQWQLHPFNDMNFNYVARVCSGVQPR